MILTTRAPLDSTPIERRPWAAPCLTAHASMTVLTQSVLGMADAMVLLQVVISGGGTGGGGPNGDRSPAQPVQPGSSGPPQH